jgi:hypothetical protein
MPRTRVFARAIIGFCAAAFLVAVVVPHVHADPAHAHPGQVCRACKIQDGFSAASPSMPAGVALSPAPLADRFLSESVSCASPLRLTAGSRAPPTRS